jgi:glycosyltransferase involved in cell wall biosynthesis
VKPPTADAGRIGYVLKRYPRLSETFIVQEIVQMEQRGADLVVFAIMDPHESLQNPLIAQVKAPIIYVQHSLIRDLAGMLFDQLRLALRSPRRYRQAVCHLLRRSGISRTTLKVFLQAGRLAVLARKARIRHLHAHFAHNPTSLARYAGLLTGIPFSFTAHAKDLYLTRPESITDKARLATFITTCTAYNARYLGEVVCPADRAKINIVYHGVDTRRFHPPAVAPHNPLPTVVSAGRLVPKKGYDHLITAAAELHRREVPFRLDIYGDGPLREDLARRIADFGLQDIVVLQGACTQIALSSAYRAADIFVLAPVVMSDGDRDGIPNVLMEAMASGLPVVTTNISGIPEVVTDGSDGLLVPPADPAALAAALATLLGSPARRQQLGEAARRTVTARYDADENAAGMALLLGLEETRDADRLPIG